MSAARIAAEVPRPARCRYCGYTLPEQFRCAEAPSGVHEPVIVLSTLITPQAAASTIPEPEHSVCRACGASAALTAEALALIEQRDTAEAEAARLREQLDVAAIKLVELSGALTGMIRQFGYWSDAAGGYATYGLSALQDAFSALGWSDPHPYPAGRCEEPGCLRQGTCGTPTQSGYRWLCDEHDWFTPETDR